MKRKLKELIEATQGQLSPLLEERQKVQGNIELSSEGKFRAITKLNVQMDLIRSGLLKDVTKLFDDTIQIAKNEKRDVYGSSFNTETQCKLQFIQAMKSDLTKPEVENLIGINADNPVITRALIPLAKEHDLTIDMSAYMFDNIINIEQFRDTVLPLIKGIVEGNQDQVMPLTLAMIFANDLTD
ncbi:hypothetical protein NE172_08990 [Clostridium botulinum]|uniref:Uncharacterized protein n=1 Tax=Clostridium botulinum TaxID=1491 RepID=A0A6B4JMN9_CLOBO|nr:hypothetical protein [Clostridium botulinum]EES50250.1 hypothetical protein CLO_2824 [Clostridium botulinum E1 str. 'BoNT E Beluga']MBY6761468.1 hypothetical protein [Clostridium botulinum]MBY6920200.1 hypothetical protein [Clostridium botulinum]MCR1131091.1 hypothetical protein [Clostridium botulinum]NFJ58091.1 hypothetical protein [Clostridium botulinum]